MNVRYCDNICLRISRAVAVTNFVNCRHPRALAPKYRLLWKKPPWWYFHVFQWRSHCSRLASLKGCSSKVVGGWAMIPLDHGSVDLSQVCTDFRYSLPENFHDMEIIGLKIVAILSSCGVRGEESKSWSWASRNSSKCRNYRSLHQMNIFIKTRCLVAPEFTYGEAHIGSSGIQRWNRLAKFRTPVPLHRSAMDFEGKRNLFS